jgi:NADH-quinone oxidoreductase subunit F
VKRGEILPLSVRLSAPGSLAPLPAPTGGAIALAESRPFDVGEALLAQWERIVARYPKRRGAVMGILHTVQDRLGFLSSEAIAQVARFLGIPDVQVWEVVTFYPMFRTSPPGRRTIQICHNIACDLRGAGFLLRSLCDRLRVRPGETTADGAFTLEGVECLAACDRAPVAIVDGTLCGPLDPSRPEALLHEEPPEPATTSEPRIPEGTDSYLLARCAKGDVVRIEAARKEGAWRTFEKVLAGMTPAAVVEIVKASGLRGRGGAGFLAGLKWSFMPPREDPRPRAFLLNADESEPGTFKDHLLLERDPHLVLEGLAICAFAIGAHRAFIYLRGESRRARVVLQRAIEEAYAAGTFGKDIRGSGFDLEVVLHVGGGAYIAGEETGAMESIEGKPARPRPKPPFPAGYGLWGWPTTINNVETVANVPAIVERGAEGYRRLGTEKSPGNFLCGVSGDVERPGVYELPLGIPVREVIERCAGGVRGGRALKGFYAGGSSVGILPASAADVGMDHEALRAAGSMLGTGGLVALDETACVVRATEVLARFYEHETCGQCSQCRIGCAWIHPIVRDLEAGRGPPGALDLLLDLCKNMSGGKTICAFADGAALPVVSALRHFRGEFERHVLQGGCPFPARA